LRQIRGLKPMSLVFALRKSGNWRFELILINTHRPLSLYQTTSHLYYNTTESEPDTCNSSRWVLDLSFVFWSHNFLQKITKDAPVVLLKILAYKDFWCPSVSHPNNHCICYLFWGVPLVHLLLFFVKNCDFKTQMTSPRLT
jgi:hypothetical protein